MNWRDVRAKLIALRQSRGFTQVMLADQCGISVKTISAFEADPIRCERMKVWQLEAITNACGVTLERFFGATAADFGAVIGERVKRVTRAAMDQHATKLLRMAQHHGDASDGPTSRSSLATSHAVPFRVY
jgi:DNA-binding XRE family transcriptional regulator